MSKIIPIEQYIIHSEAEQNVLPLGFLCHNRCIFCSHKNIEKNSYLNNFCLYKRDIDEIADHIKFLNPSKRVIIGESATKIFEGEPFMRPDIADILKMIRKHIGANLISVTTCGAYFREDFFDNIEQIAPIEINFSLNSFNSEVRERILPDGRSEQTFTALEKLCGLITANNQKTSYNNNNALINTIGIYEKNAPHNFITLSVSLMAINPELTPINEISKDIQKLRALDEITLIKIYLPRFSNLLFEKFFNSYESFEKYCKEISEKFADINSLPGQTPVIIEPGAGIGTENSVAGIIPGSRAELAGIKASDEILAVNAIKPLTKSHCFELISKYAGDLNIKLKRKKSGIKPAENKGIALILTNETEFEVKFKDFNGKNEGAGGMVFESDMGFYSLNELIKTAEKLRNSNKKALFFTSKLSIEYIRNLFKKYKLADVLAPVAAENQYFGGNIDCAGLLTLSDIEKNIYRPEIINFMNSNNISDIIIPEILFDHLDIDLEGNKFIDFQEKLPYRIIKI